MNLSVNKAIELVNAINDLVKTMEAQNLSASELISRMQIKKKVKKMHEIRFEEGELLTFGIMRLMNAAEKRNEKVKGKFNGVMLVVGPGYKHGDIERYYEIVLHWMSLDKKCKNDHNFFSK